MVAVSKALFDKLEAYKKRMGWTFKWVSSLASDFNRDYQVSFTPEEMQKGEMYYITRRRSSRWRRRPVLASSTEMRMAEYFILILAMRVGSIC
jgi:predicted dithiol-disulfide oxidoreductase (DUF899 family)